MNVSNATMFSVVALFWALVFVWAQLGFFAVIAAAAIADMALSLYTKNRREAVRVQSRSHDET